MEEKGLGFKPGPSFYFESPVFPVRQIGTPRGKAYILQIFRPLRF